MYKVRAKWLSLVTALVAAAVANSGCTTQASKAEFFGKVEPPAGQVMRYISGSEPESLDPQVGTGQPEARIYMALFEGLAEYDPKTMEPIPAIAERWDVNKDSSEFIFHLRRDAKWSNGEPITAHDFVYTFRRGLSPELAARNGYLAYEIKYAQGYNEAGVFVRDAKTGEFLLAKDFAEAPEGGEAAAAAAAPAESSAPAAAVPTDGEDAALDTEFHKFMHSPMRLVLAGDEKTRAKEIDANPKLKAAVAGKEFVPVKAEDIGVEAIDDHTFRVTLTQPAPYFIGLVPHQFFRAVPRKAIERHGATNWTQPANIITSGPFRLASWKPYNEIVVEKDPNYWDAASVRLNRIHFYPLEDQTTMQNLYKTGDVDATYNHTVPVAWLKAGMRQMKDYMDAPECAIEYYQINITKPPMNDKRVRKAFNLAIDKKALSEYRVVTKPLTAFTPEGIFPGYPQPKGDEFNPERAKQLLAEAGYKDASGKFDPKKFPVSEVELTYNTAGSNKEVAEFVQAQWKQNLDGLTIPLKNMEWKTFLQSRANLEYKGFARSGWVGDYMDPYTFLALFSTIGGDNGTGWFKPEYVDMLRKANSSPSPEERYRLLSEAEKYLLEEQPVIPLQTNATNWMKKPYVKGMYPNPGTLHAWKYVYIEYDSAKWDRGVPDMTPDRQTTAD
ncbi:MAG TPA: peptide ABC transporter substrate-binding protein [Pyrinomonadaceae bacterium]|nr:peptide ABC transporter substrate-binding protein [Pyrinomonadaceae bacterium]